MAAAGNTVEQVTAFIDARIVSRPDGPEGPVVLRRTVVLAGRGLTDEVLGLVIARFAQWHGVAGGKVEDDRQTRQQQQQQVQLQSPSSLPPGGVLFDLAMNNLTRAGAVALMRLAADCTAFADVRLVGNRLDFATMGAVLAAVRSNAEILAAAARGKRALVALVTADARVRRRLEAAAVASESREPNSAAVASESREPHAAPVDRVRDGADQSVQVVDGGSSGNQDRQQHVDHEPQQCEHLAPPDVVATIWAALLDRPLPRGAATAKVFATYNSQSFVSDP